MYVAQQRLQEELEELFAALDKASGTPTGRLDKGELRTALAAYWRVGQEGGKTPQRFDELIQVGAGLAAVDCGRSGVRARWCQAAVRTARGRQLCPRRALAQHPPPCCQAMDEDQEGSHVEWTKVFEEDREFNQGGRSRGGDGGRPSHANAGMHAARTPEDRPPTPRP